MTLDARIYLAAHAPAEPWLEFEPVGVPPAPTSPLLVGDNGKWPSDDEVLQCHRWRRDPSGDLGLPNFSLWEAAMKAFWAKSNDHERARIAAVCRQWPWYYAAAMLKAGGYEP